MDGQVHAHVLVRGRDPESHDHSMTLAMTNVSDAGEDDRECDRHELDPDLLGLAVDGALAGGLMARVANTPVARAPKMPPTPWTANTSSASSTLRRALSSVAL